MNSPGMLSSRSPASWRKRDVKGKVYSDTDSPGQPIRGSLLGHENIQNL